jgi:hypothetical protein
LDSNVNGQFHSRSPGKHASPLSSTVLHVATNLGFATVILKNGSESFAEYPVSGLLWIISTLITDFTKDGLDWVAVNAASSLCLNLSQSTDGSGCGQNKYG